MEYIGIGIVIAVIIVAGIIIYKKNKKRQDIPSGDEYHNALVNLGKV